MKIQTENNKNTEKAKPYILQVLSHKWYIIRAGLRVGNFPLWRLLVHDLSKFSPTEFFVYRRRFTNKSYSKDHWKRAWLHHIHHNPHHHEHWVLNNEPIQMPDIYIREMVIDWMAAGRGYQGNWNIQPWLNENYKKIRIHPLTLEKLKLILASQGFNWPEN